MTIQQQGRVGYGHPFQCRVYGCLQIVAWLDLQPGALTPGFCDAHRTRAATVPIAIYGHEHDGWCPYPMSLVTYLDLRARGAFDDAGRTRPVHEWSVTDARES